MSFLGRLLGRKSGSAYTDGIALYEEGRFDEAAAVLRGVVESVRNDSGSLADFYLRQSLTREGRRLMDEGDVEASLPFFDEAARRWSTFPDLRFWYGLALARADRWPDVLDTVRIALERNGDYVEARLLEAAALVRLDQREAAAESLNALVSAGARVEHPLIRYLTNEAPYDAAAVPDDLVSLLHESAGQDRGRDAVQQAVDICRDGSWEEGIERMRQLCEEKPAYPDFRVKLAAALFQTGRNNEALEEVAQALVLNPRYRTAAHLKALILADQHRFSEAREVIQAQDVLTDPANGHPGEELFCSYLAATLSLLTGRFDEVRGQLERWHDLATSFPTAELLLAAADELQGRHAAVRDRLTTLADQWAVDDQYRRHLACHQLRHGDLDALEHSLERLSDPENGDDDSLKMYLSARLAAARGRDLDGIIIPEDKAHEPAWRYLGADILAARGRWLEALLELRKLAAEGAGTERLASLMSRAYLALDESEDTPVPDVMPDSVLQDRVCLLHRQERTGRALSVLRHHQELHPEDLRWVWLNPTFWLDPIRRWIG